MAQHWRIRHLCLVLGLMVAAVMGSALAAQEDCAPHWADGFGAPGLPFVEQAVMFDDGLGAGPRLHVIGLVPHADGVSWGVARWEGDQWVTIGVVRASIPQSSSAYLRAIEVADLNDGRGQGLFVGGAFAQVNGVPANGIARWDGVRWEPVGAGVDEGAGQINVIRHMAEGSAPGLYIGGDFVRVGGVSMRFVARWDGQSWHSTGNPGFIVYDMEVTRNVGGQGPCLIVGQGTSSAGFVSRWDGSGWSVIGQANGPVRGVRAHTEEQGRTSLYASGLFTHIEGVQTRFLAMYRDSAWTPVDMRLSGVSDLRLNLRPNGVKDSFDLVVSGAFTVQGFGPRTLMLLRQGEWIDPGLNSTRGVVSTLVLTPDGDDAAMLVVCGSFSRAGNVVTPNIALFEEGVGWSGFTTPGEGITGSNLVVRAMAVGPDVVPGETALYVGGQFDAAGFVPLANVGRWDGSSWRPLGDGLNASVNALAGFQDGLGTLIYAGGGFTASGQTSVQGIARWDGAAWHSVGEGLQTSQGGSGIVRAMTVYDDGHGAGERLVVTGTFTKSGSTPLPGRVAAWDGQQWSSLGTGLPTSGTINSMIVFDDGEGPMLYAGGQFSSIGGVAAAGLARWDGLAWHPVPGWTSGTVRAMHVHDDGGGPELYVLGDFSGVGGLNVQDFARYRDGGWRIVGVNLQSGDDWSTMATFDDGIDSRPALFLLGEKAVWRWNGQSWRSVYTRDPNNGLGTHPIHVARPFVFGADRRPALYLGGGFWSVGATPSNYIAAWVGCPTFEEALLNALEITRGTHLFGDVNSIRHVSSGWLRVRSGYGQTFTDLHSMILHVRGMTAAASPETLGVNVVSRVNQPSGTQRVQLRNWDTGTFVTIGTSVIGPFDRLHTMENIQASRFVRHDGAIEVSIRHVVVAPVFAFNFESDIDWVQVMVR